MAKRLEAVNPGYIIRCNSQSEWTELCEQIEEMGGVAEFPLYSTFTDCMRIYFSREKRDDPECRIYMNQGGYDFYRGRSRYDGYIFLDFKDLEDIPENEIGVTLELFDSLLEV